jgi:signal transduction histidine kinase/predicted RNA-binding protein with RPS1 domain/DNA-binding response OmpR family regulator
MDHTSIRQLTTPGQHTESREFTLKSKRVVVKVEQIFPFGVFVRLQDGTEGYIRRRELAWGKDVDPRQLVAVGDTFEAIELPSSDQSARRQRRELSRRATLGDPWQEFFRRYHRGDVVQGHVTDVASFGVFVEILPGVDGLIPLQDIIPLGVEKPDDLLWVGDDVEAVITRIGRQDKKVRLSIRERVRQLDRAATQAFLRRPPADGVSIAEHLGLSTADVMRQMESENESKEKDRTIAPQRVSQVMVVDAEAAVRQPLVEWFRRQGYQTVGFESAAAALERLPQQPCDLILVDVDLPGSEGLSLIHQINLTRHDETGPIVAVVGSVEGIEKQIAELERLSIAEVLIKPLDLCEVERFLSQLERGEPVASRIGWPDKVTAGTASESFRQHADLKADRKPKGISLSQQLDAILSRLVETTQAEKGLLFRVHSISCAISIAAQTGDLGLNEDALYSLEDSPVRDVIREERPVLEGRASAREGRFRKLLDLLPFESCIGAPVEGQSGARYALFLFHRAPDVFSRYRVRDALASAALMTAAIDRDEMSQHLRSQQRLLLLGQLAAGFGHEVYNQVSGLELRLRNLQTDCNALTTRADNSRVAGDLDLRDLCRDLDDTLVAATDLNKTVGLFQQLTRPRPETTLSVNRVVEQAVTLLNPTAYRNKVEIQTDLATELPSLVGDTTQLQQVVLNLMLNAIQQMALKSQAGGALKLVTCLAHGDGQQWIEIRVQDEGPGIHKQLWEQIFSLGYSTRRGGTGLGLFVARSLTESLGGQLTVEQSVIPIGTTFLIELPVTTREKEDTT